VLTGVLAVTLLALAGFDLAAVTALRGYLLDQTDTQLGNVLAEYRVVTLPQTSLIPAHHTPPVFRRSPSRSPGSGTRRIVGPFAVLPGALGRFYVASRDRNRPAVLVGGNEDLVPRLPADLAALARSHQAATVLSTNGRTQLRIMAESFPNTGIVYATTSLTDLDNTVNRVGLIMIIGSACAGLLAAAGTFWVMRRGLRPVEDMAAQADKISAGDLASQVDPGDPSTEVGRLGIALNGMLARIHAFIAERESSQEATRRFFADASHELRTPLASLRANAELYQQGVLKYREQVDEAMHRITAEAQRMSTLLDGMLRLARLDQYPEREHQPVDLTALVTEAARRAATADPWRSWQADVADGLLITGDEELLRRAISNLFANVTAHTPEGTTATITAAAAGAVVTLVVSDDGPGVPAEQLPKIFERFYRGPAPSFRSGSGLGLAIAAVVAAAHDGTAEAVLNDPHGLRVTLTLPVDRLGEHRQHGQAAAAVR
jgi:two-component system OmpR family sensor kinase